MTFEDNGIPSPESDASAKGSPKNNTKTHATGTSPSKKRSASSVEPAGASKVTKRRAARACTSCRARKVRCDVVEGAPCGNCRWDNVECIVQESRRRKKNVFGPSTHAQQKVESGKHQASNSPVSISPATGGRRQSQASTVSSSASSFDPTNAVGQQTLAGAFLNGGGHVPHLICKSAILASPATDQRSGLGPDGPLLLAHLHAQASKNGSRYPNIWPNPQPGPGAGFGDIKTAQFLSSLEEPDASTHLPAFIRPLPTKIPAEDVNYLQLKGALALPSLTLQNALLRAYVEYVHPYMPLMELHDFLSAINSPDGLYGQISLFLYHAVMFASTAYVDMKYLKEAGYPTRKAARRAFFQKTRLLYDFDYESDRLVLVQSLLLMTYWYETPDDQKDTWHWMGVAISLAHTIGLHRNPAATSMSPRKQKLWKRIWWSCFMRDRLIALGMRRPTRIKDEDYDVPMLDEEDFEIAPLADDVQVVTHDCTLARDVRMQQELASLCVAKAKLCLCISQMLNAQYSVLIRDKSRPENTTNSTMMLHPKKQLENLDNVAACDHALATWVESLPGCCRYRPLTQLDMKDGEKTIAVQRNLLHMVYYTTISALHRPQFLHSSPMHVPVTSTQAQEVSRLKVRDAALHVTRMVTELHQLNLERYLPTTGVTVILPAMIIHLLEMKNPVPLARDKANSGFKQCMKVMKKLRDIYSAADYAVAFLDAACRKAAVDQQAAAAAAAETGKHLNLFPATPPFIDDIATPPPENAPYMTQPEAEVLGGGHSFVPPGDLMSSHTPPQTEKESLTPSASGSSDGSVSADIDMDFNGGAQDEFDWNALTGTNLDFDQWLQFPAEGNGNKTTTENDKDGFMDMLVDGQTEATSVAPAPVFA